GYLGIAGQNVPIHRRLVRHFDLPRESGVLIVGIEENSPAAAAGLRQGDVISAMGEYPIESIDDLQRLLTDDGLGRTQTMTIVRRDEKREVQITPAESPRRE